MVINGIFIRQLDNTLYLNFARIIGNLTRDVELRTLNDGGKVASFGVATNESYKDKQGNKVESVEFHNCVAWGKAGELIAQYMGKGSNIMVAGKLRTSSWEKEGVKHYKTEIIVKDFQFGRKSTNAVQNTQNTPTTQAQQAPLPQEPVNNEINTADIPF